MMSIIQNRAAWGKVLTRPSTVVIVAAALFFFVSAMLAYGATEKFDSPDETANFVFASRFAAGQPLVIDQPVMAFAPNAVPRGFGARTDALIPGSFLGLIALYGAIGSWFGPGSMLFLTPFFSALAVVVFFGLIKQWFSERVAMISALLLVLHPAFWYWTARAMYHNALLVDLLLVGLYFLVRATRTTSGQPASLRFGQYLVAGLALGAAVAVRTSEIVWLALIVAIVLFARRQNVHWRLGLPLAIVGGLVPIGVVLSMNAELYGHPLSFAYSQSPINTASINTAASGLIEKVSQLFFPFGVNWGAIGLNAWEYGLKLFWPFSLPSLLGLFWFLRESKTRAQRTYAWTVLGVVAWLVVYYGSWQFSDNPDPTVTTIGNSYTRYWLAAYIGLLPFAAQWFARLVESVRPSAVGAHRRLTFSVRIAAASLVMVGVVSFSLARVVVDPAEGLVAVRTHGEEYRRRVQLAVAATPADSVIIGDRADKVFFPERSVIVRSDTARDQAAIRRAAQALPVFVYVTAAESPQAVEETWSERGFRLSKEIPLDPGERLYRLIEL